MNLCQFQINKYCQIYLLFYLCFIQLRWSKEKRQKASWDEFICETVKLSKFYFFRHFNNQLAFLDLKFKQFKNLDLLLSYRSWKKLNWFVVSVKNKVCPKHKTKTKTFCNIFVKFFCSHQQATFWLTHCSGYRQHE